MLVCALKGISLDQVVVPVALFAKSHFLNTEFRLFFLLFCTLAKAPQFSYLYIW